MDSAPPTTYVYGMDIPTDDFARLQADLTILVNTDGLPPEAHRIIRRFDGLWRIDTGLYVREITGERPPVPYLLFGTIEAFVREHPFSGDLHWLFTSVSVGQGGVTAHIQLDDRRQPVLESQISALDWVYDGRDYRLRNVTLIRRALD